MLDMNNNGEEMEHTTLSTTEKRDYDSDLLHRKLKIYKPLKIIASNNTGSSYQFEELVQRI